MNTRPSPGRGAAIALIALLSSAATLVAQTAPTNVVAPPQNLVALKTAGPGANLVLLPVQVQGKPDRHIADVLGLAIEGYGMNKLDAIDLEFAPPADAKWEQVPNLMADFIKKNQPKGEFFLYAQYLGEPKSGPTEVRFIVTDSSGKIVLIDRQTAADKDFQNTAARDPDPMGCSVLVADRLFSQTGWVKTAGKAKEEGKFARKWAELSGLPPQAERDAMKARAGTMKKEITSGKIAVYATCIGPDRNLDSAKRLAPMIAKQFGCQAIIAEKPMITIIAPSSNEQKRLWDLARAFREHIKANKPDAEYALLADFYLDPKGGEAGAVHFVVCEKNGDWVLVDFQNNQQEDFQKLVPKTTEDCEKLAVERMAKLLK